MELKNEPLKYLYILVRIPKSGSQTLRKMVHKSFVGSSHFSLPRLDIDQNVDRSLTESFRRNRRLLKGMSAYGALTEKGMWKKISAKAKSGDIISGHIACGRADLPGWGLRYVTLMRDPIERMVSEYFYTREGYLKRQSVRKIYLKGRPEAAAKGSFSDYLEYLCFHKERYANPATAYVTGSRTHLDPFEFLKQNYFHFGVLEAVGTFAQQLAEKTNTEPSEFWVNKTKTRSKYELSDKDRELLGLLLDKDISLYEEAKESIM